MEKGTRKLDVLGIAGSLREGSYNRALLRAAREAAPEGSRVRIYDGLGDVPPYDQDRDVSPAPAAVADLRESIARSDALLVATPEYNHSVPQWAREDLRKVLEAAGAEVLDAGLAVSRAPERLDGEGRLTDAEVRRGLVDLLVGLAELAAAEGEVPRAAASPTG